LAFESLCLFDIDRGKIGFVKTRVDQENLLLRGCFRSMEAVGLWNGCQFQLKLGLLRARSPEQNEY
jgi:hypothetical protein|tara:strand:- start:412 stop:609 length:198 start_codon:yes stop_codon:yes gene_type:complete